jgi:hypothetical protein
LWRSAKQSAGERLLSGAYASELKFKGSEHSEQDRPNESKGGDDRQYVNPTGEKHVQSPLWLR